MSFAKAFTVRACVCFIVCTFALENACVVIMYFGHVAQYVAIIILTGTNTVNYDKQSFDVRGRHKTGHSTQRFFQMGKEEPDVGDAWGDRF